MAETAAKENTPVVVELKDLTKSYREAGKPHVIFQNLSQTIRRGEFVVLLGRSGSGKSTLLNLISGIDVPDTGDVIIEGIHLARLSEKARTLFRRRRIGFIFQAFNLLATLTVEENLLLPLQLKCGRRPTDREAVSLLLRQLGLAGREASFPDRLSGGEQQRVAIARALIHEPAIVLADEPTGNLDQETGRNVLAFLQQSVKTRGNTLLMVTHSLEVAAMADRVLTFRQGRLLPETGEIGEIGPEWSPLLHDRP